MALERFAVAELIPGPCINLMDAEGCSNVKIRHVNDELYCVELVIKLYKAKDSSTSDPSCNRLSGFTVSKNLAVNAHSGIS
jgi:hypothetical protein